MKSDTPEHFKLEAVGQSGAFTVEILETTAGGRLVSIQAEEWTFNFALAGCFQPGILTHLRESRGGAGMQLGLFQGAPMMLLRDDEFTDRFFLRACLGGQSVEFVIAGDSLAQFTEATAEALQELAG